MIGRLGLSGRHNVPRFAYSRPLRRVLSDAVESSSKDLTTETFSNLMRHGPGDAVIVLNVGGKEFCTLRSTVAANAVLAEHVARAEENQELTHKGAAVFIDRDPTHFHLILNHLRNKVEGISYSTFHCPSNGDSSALRLAAKFDKSSKSHVQLPKDDSALRDIYVEASHYQIPELRAAACEQKWIAAILGALGTTGNPFDQTAKFLQNMRRGMLTVGGLGTIAAGCQHDMSSIMAKIFPAWFSQEETPKDDDQKQIAEA